MSSFEAELELGADTLTGAGEEISVAPLRVKENLLGGAGLFSPATDDVKEEDDGLAVFSGVGTVVTDD